MVVLVTTVYEQRTYYLDQNLGPVIMPPPYPPEWDPAHRFELTRVDEGVPTWPSTWGVIKALYK